MMLMLAHLPWLVPYYRGLLQRSHYDFVPLALLTAAVLIWTRGDFAGGRFKGPKLWIPVMIDLACLSVAIAKNSPWFSAAGMIALVYGILLNVPDKDFRCSLWSLTLLPLLTLRPPLNYDLDLVHWMQPVTTKCASVLLNFLGAFHLLDGNVLTFPGKRFLVEEACSGVQSVFAVLFLAVFVGCLQRRRHLVFLGLILSGIFFAGVTNVLRIISIALAWEYFQWDISSGWQHDVLGYATLLIAALLTLSADAFLAYLTSPVPSDQVTRGCHAKAVFWNRMTNVLPRTSADPS